MAEEEVAEEEEEGGGGNLGLGHRDSPEEEERVTAITRVGRRLDPRVPGGR